MPVIVKESEKPDERKPLNLAVVLSGGQAPGGHNVIAGIYDYCKQNGGKMYGFLNGPHGVYTCEYKEINDEFMNEYRNMGGFDMIGSGRHKIETEEQFNGAINAARKLDLDGIIIIGGDDSNTNAAILAEKFAEKGEKCKVVGCPKTIDGDLKNEFIPISFGFDTATKTFSEEIGNICSDAVSSQKYWHFIRLMGRSASHVTLECALQTHPNETIIGEEVAEKKLTLKQISVQIAESVAKRSNNDREYGVVLLPEGLIEFIPEMGTLLSAINEIVAHNDSKDTEVISKLLTPEMSQLFLYLPPTIQHQLLLDRDAHGNVQVSMIETEQLIIGTVAQELEIMRKEGKYHGTFTPQCHFLGYEGRCGLPSLFDATYCYTLGYNAGCLVNAGKTGLMSFASNIDKDPSEWIVGGTPLTNMMNIERRSGKDKPVIRKALVTLDGPAMTYFLKYRQDWSEGDHYRNPGPVQFEGESAGEVNITLQLEEANRK